MQTQIGLTKTEKRNSIKSFNDNSNVLRSRTSEVSSDEGERKNNPSFFRLLSLLAIGMARRPSIANGYQGYPRMVNQEPIPMMNHQPSQPYQSIPMGAPRSSH